MIISERRENNESTLSSRGKLTLRWLKSVVNKITTKREEKEGGWGLGQSEFLSIKM
jgi:hypothetical protein